MTEIGTMTSIFPIAYGFRCGLVCRASGLFRIVCRLQVLLLLGLPARSNFAQITSLLALPALPHPASVVVSGVLGSRTSSTHCAAGPIR